MSSCYVKIHFKCWSYKGPIVRLLGARLRFAYNVNVGQKFNLMLYNRNIIFFTLYCRCIELCYFKLIQFLKYTCRNLNYYYQKMINTNFNLYKSILRKLPSKNLSTFEKRNSMILHGRSLSKNSIFDIKR